MSAWRDATGRVRWFWVVAAFAALAAGLEVAQLVGLALLGVHESGRLDATVFFFTLPSLLSGLVATVLCRLLFQERTGLEHGRPGRELALGFGLGAGAITLAVAAAWCAGAVSLQPGADVHPRWLAIEFLALAPAGVGEELLLRGLAFTALRRGVGDRAAVLGSGLVFGALHLTNPHGSWVAALIIALVGLWFGLTAVRSGSAWRPIGLHLGWNFFEGSVLGSPVSGVPAGRPLLEASWGPAGFWSGGAFGPEAAPVTAIVLGIALVGTFWWRRALT